MKKNSSFTGVIIALGIGIWLFNVLAENPEYLVAVLLVAALWWYFASRSSSPKSSTELVRGNSDAPELILRVSVGTRSGDRDPPRKLDADPDALWVPAGESRDVAGYRIEGGMVYVGQGLAGGDEWDVEAALIDPKLPVAKGEGDYTERQLSYWPSYRGATPEARAAYLHWLADGRRDPEADVGYVFLFFYGLERRALVDAESSSAAQRELLAIRAEVERLLAIYGESRSFDRYARSLLDFLRLKHGDPKVAPTEPPLVYDAREPSLDLKLGLAHFAQAGEPLPADWALAWVRSDPNIRLRTPAKRCPDTFERAFRKLYEGRFGSGLKLPRNKTRIKVGHHSASPTLRLARSTEIKLDLPDVTVLSAPMKKIAPIVESATDQIAAYSRFVGRNPDGAESADALIQLPATLWPDAVRRPFEEVRDTVSRAKKPLVIDFGKLCGWLPEWEAVTRAKFKALATSLGSLGLGVEPDPRFGGKHPEADDAKVVLYAHEGVEDFRKPSPEYAAAALTLHLAAAVSAADGQVDEAERTLLMQQMEQWLHLERPARRRLHAHLRLLLAEPPGLKSLKKRIEALGRTERQAIGEFLAQVARADDEVSASEVKLLERIYKMLELDIQTLYSAIHAAEPAAAPVTVKADERGSGGYAVPAKPETPAVELDMERVARLHADSEKVSAILGAIFEEEAAEPEPEPAAEEQEGQEPELSIMGLDGEHSALILVLLGRDRWERSELEELAADREILLDGALEQINEAAFETYDEPLVEGDDPLEINPNLSRELVQ